MTNVNYARPFYRLIWASYALDPDEDIPLPMETKESEHLFLNDVDIYEMRKFMHGCGFKLMEVVKVDPNLDEF